MKAQGYTRAVIELEFDAGDNVTKEEVYEYLHSLIMNNELYVEYYDKQGNNVTLTHEE